MTEGMVKVEVTECFVGYRWAFRGGFFSIFFSFFWRREKLNVSWGAFIWPGASLVPLLPLQLQRLSSVLCVCVCLCVRYVSC